MTTKRQIEAQKTIREVTAYIKSHPGVFHRITDICNSTGLAVPKVNNALRRMYDQGLVVSEMRRKKSNGKRYPVYLYYSHATTSDYPSWLYPQVPKFAKSQLRELRTVLGFTGNLGLKAALEKSGR